MENTNSKIKEANEYRYDNLHEVDGYIKKRYHSLRLEIGRNMVDDFFKSKDTNASDIRILEIASSTGFQSNALQKSGYSIYSSDLQLRPLQTAKRSFSLKCIQFDAEFNFPFKSGAFDALFVGELIEHLFDVSNFLNECNRVLSRGGLLVITTPNLASLQDRFNFVFGHSPRHINPFHDYLKLHIRPFTKDSLVGALKNFGFNIVSVKSSFLRIRFKGGKRLNLRFPAKYFPSIGSNLIVGSVKMKEK